VDTEVCAGVVPPAAAVGPAALTGAELVGLGAAATAGTATLSPMALLGSVLVTAWR
jgi:hypothetical protein